MRKSLKETQKKYRESEKGKAAVRRAQKKYRRSEKGKAAYARAQKRYRQKKKANLFRQMAYRVGRWLLNI